MKMEHESIFLHTIRSFFVALFGVAGGLIGLIIMLMIAVGLFSPSSSDKQLPPRAKIMPNADGCRNERGASSPVILQIAIDGTIGLGDVTASKIEEILISSREDSLKDGRVKGIILVIDTGGGSANDSAIIYRRLKAYKERFGVPVYAYVDGLCASGGYYIACACDEIYASSVSLIGSIGVLVWPPYINVHEALKKLGVNTETVFAGKGKDEMNPFRPWMDGECVNHQYIADFYYQNFVDVVVANREQISKEALVQQYGARVFPAPQAQEYGFVDKIDVDLSDLVGKMANDLGIEENYQVIQFKTKSWLQERFGFNHHSPLFSGCLKHEVGTPQPSAVNYLYAP